MKPCDFYDCEPEREVYTHTTPDEAIEAYLDDHPAPSGSRRCYVQRGHHFAIGPVGDLRAVACWKPTDTITVYGFRRKVLTRDDIGSPLDMVLDELADGEFGSPGPDQSSLAMGRMRSAEEAFVAVLVASYEVWHCEEDEAARTEVNIVEWVREHRPDWLEVKP